MSIDLLLRALRKCEREVSDLEWEASEIRSLSAVEAGRVFKWENLADKIHKKIVERFEKMMKAGKELYLDKWVREQEENLRHVGDEA